MTYTPEDRAEAEAPAMAVADAPEEEEEVEVVLGARRDAASDDEEEAEPADGGGARSEGEDSFQSAEGEASSLEGAHKSPIKGGRRDLGPGQAACHVAWVDMAAACTCAQHAHCTRAVSDPIPARTLLQLAVPHAAAGESPAPVSAAVSAAAEKAPEAAAAEGKPGAASGAAGDDEAEGSAAAAEGEEGGSAGGWRA